jgi:hypothetical protein
MSIITISRGSYSRGKEVAERIQFLARKTVGFDVKVNFTLAP